MRAPDLFSALVAYAASCQFEHRNWYQKDAVQLRLKSGASKAHTPSIANNKGQCLTSVALISKKSYLWFQKYVLRFESRGSTDLTTQAVLSPVVAVLRFLESVRHCSGDLARSTVGVESLRNQKFIQKIHAVGLPCCVV